MFEPLWEAARYKLLIEKSCDERQQQRAKLFDDTRWSRIQMTCVALCSMNQLLDLLKSQH